jgi:hypothetical protein
MKKIISLFKRNYTGDRKVVDEVVPGAEWVLAGEGVATRKFDGTCCMVRGGVLFKRYDAKVGRTPPKEFEPAQEADPVTGHQPGWLPVSESPEDRWHKEGLKNTPDVVDGTYELVGPKIQGNPENFSQHYLVKHGAQEITDCPRTYAELKAWLKDATFEGIVWHHPDGRMVKIKRKDFF